MARIVLIADVFDALCTQRPDKEAWPLVRVLAALRDGAGQQFDPPFVARLKTILPAILEVREHWDQRALDPLDTR